MIFKRNIAKPGERKDVQPYATTPRGYPYPLRSWVPDVAIDIQNLATAVDTDIGKLGYAMVHYEYASVPPADCIPPATSVTATSGAAIGTITGGKFRLTNAGTYSIAVQSWVQVSGDGHPLPITGIMKYSAGTDLYLQYYSYGGDPQYWAMYLMPGSLASASHGVVGWTPINLLADLMIQRVA